MRRSAEVDAHLLANNVEGGWTFTLLAGTLKVIGYDTAIFPAIGCLPAAPTLERAYGHLRSAATATRSKPSPSVARTSQWTCPAQAADAVREPLKAPTHQG